MIKVDNDETGGARDTSGRNENSYKILVKKSGRKRRLGRPGSGWKESLGVAYRETGHDGVEWIRLAEEKLVQQFFYYCKCCHGNGFTEDTEVRLKKAVNIA